MIKETIFRIFVLLGKSLTLMLLFCSLYAHASEQRSPDEIRKDMEAHRREVANINKQWSVIHQATRAERERKYDEAIRYYQLALNMGDQNVPRIGLLEVYEKTGQYEKALEQVEWFLKGNQNEQGRAKSLEDKARLLKKIEAQKKRSINPSVQKNRFEELSKQKQASEATLQALLEAKESGDANRAKELEERLFQQAEDLMATTQSLANDSNENNDAKVSMVEQLKQEFPRATRADQRQFLESLGGPGVWDVFKKAMVLEHGGNFKEALSVYESLLPQKEAITKEMGIDSWVVLYPAIQRTAEFSGNNEKEKGALVWIRDYLFNPKGLYHPSRSKLEPRTISHIQDRIRTVLGTSDAS